MRLDATSISLITNGSAPKARGNTGLSVTDLANQRNASRLGIQPGTPQGSYKPVYETKMREVQETVYASKDVVEVNPIYEDRVTTALRDVFESRDVTKTEDVFESRNITATEDVFETRNVTATEDVFENRAVYTTRDIRATQVEGTRALTGYSTLSQAGIDVGADLSIQVGNGTMAVLRFESSSKISITVGNTVTNFTFNSGSKPLAATIASALDSIDGLSATLSNDGKLSLKTDNAQSLAIADVANKFLDFSGSPLAKLGLVAGTTEGKVVGTEQVQTGTEQVKTGTRTVVTGTEQVKIGTRSVVTGTEQVKVGTRTVVTGSEQVKIGTQTVVTGTQRVQVGQTELVVGQAQVATGTRLRAEAGEQVMVGLVKTDTPGGVGDLAVLERVRKAAEGDSATTGLFTLLKRSEGIEERGWVAAAYAYAGSLGRGDEVTADADVDSKVASTQSRTQSSI